jgi:hypothetical protein
MRCVICRQSFDFSAGQTAVVLHHVAYGYDFVHPGACEAAALGLIFPEPGYDCTAFAHDPERRAVLAITPPKGWSAVLPAAQAARAGDDLHFEPLRFWALIEYRDGSRRFESVVRDADWLDEPGGAEFPESRTSHGGAIGYAPVVGLQDLTELIEVAA